MGFGGIIEITHPAAVFVRKQRELMNKGYTEQKAFEVVEADLGKAINQQKEELRILRGLAVHQYGSQSYLDRFSAVAELESSLKVKRLERDLPKFLRSQASWMDEIKSQQASSNKGGDVGEGENTSYERQSIEDLLQEDSKKVFSVKKSEDAINDYEPVLYEIVKDPVAASKDREGLTSI